MLKGNNTTQCYFGNWTGMTPWCKEGKIELNRVQQDKAKHQIHRVNTETLNPSYFSGDKDAEFANTWHP